MIQYITTRAKNHLRTLIVSNNEKYKGILPVGFVEFDTIKNESEKFDILRESEPLDYYNLVSTYSMFL